MPAAARISDLHACPVHGGGPVATGEVSVLIGFMPAARVGDTAVCPPGVDSVSAGESSVLIGDKPAARMGDPTTHGGRVAVGCPTVIIGESPQALTLKTDKPFCEECERLRKEQEARQKRGER